MIFDHIDQADRYATVHCLFPKVFHYLKTTDLKSLTEGKHEIDGENFFVLVSERITIPAEKGRLETHNQYIDIQLCLRGNESFGILDRSECLTIDTPYSKEDDIAFYKDKFTNVLSLKPNHFVVFFPNDAHAPMIGNGDGIRKLIVKVPV